jgi:hypothetical protein
LWSAVRATPTWRFPVGDGAKRTRSGVGSGGDVVMGVEKGVEDAADRIGKAIPTPLG